MRRRSHLTVVPLAAAIVLGTAGTALALPKDTSGDPPPPPPNGTPTAALAVTPNPALVSPSLAVAAKVPNLGDSVLNRGRVTFDASGSADPDGTIAAYLWDLDGNGSFERTTTTPKTSRSYTAPGTLAVKVRVVDNANASATATASLKVHRAPKAAIAATPKDLTMGKATTLSAAGSSDEDGIAKVEWDLDGNGIYETSTGTALTVQAPFPTVGTKTVRVRITDTLDASSVASTAVFVHPAPAAAFTAAPAPAVVGERVVFDGSDSLDTEPIVRFEWDLDGNGSFETSTGANPKAARTYAAPGTVTTRLRITDRQGATDVETRSLTVLAQQPADRVAPVVRIGAHSSRLSSTGRVTLTVTCPASERLCAGRVAMTRRATSAAVGSRTFRLGGGQRTRVRVLLASSARRTVTSSGRLGVRITATVRDAAGNAGTARRTLTVRKAAKRR